MSGNLLIGDAVIPADKPYHDVMTIYDFECGGRLALCNWLVGTKMSKTKEPVSNLVRVLRKSDKERR